METRTQVANRALMLVGQAAIKSFDDGSDRAFLVNQFWDLAFNAVLAEHPWHFAVTEAALPEIQTRRENYFGEQENAFGGKSEYLHAWALPEDFIKLAKIIGDTYPKYEIVILNNQRALLYNGRKVSIIYITKKAGLDYFTPPAQEALAIRLALYFDQVRNGGAAQQNLMQQYQISINAAIRQEPAAHSRNGLFIGEINHARHESTAYGITHKLRERCYKPGHLQPY